MAYAIEYSPDAVEHLDAMSARDQRRVLDSVERQLSHEPRVETRNRKPMRPNPLAPWELRIGDLRVYYDVMDAPEAVVQVLAVGIMRRNRIWIGGVEFEL
ncbi:hypothetical protein RAS1_01790 [Phycisphaerae bacterium RAS1]|nr:hypothetical protein RAS1_01790 [Phycisphaerae bacterium RAS1]